MYLEISPRQTGKTTRLIEMANHLDETREDVSCILVTMNHHMKRYMCSHFKKNPTILVITQAEVKKTMLGYRGRTVTPILFYDEFDFMEPENVIVNTEFYYATTAKRMRDYIDIIEWKAGIKRDPMLSLLKANGWMYTAKSSIGWLATDIDEMLYKIRSAYPDSLYTEYEGRFLNLSVKHVSN